MTETNKTLSLFGALTLVSFVGFQALSVNASATYGDNCNEIFTYEKSSDYNDNRVTIDFINTQSSGNPDSVSVSADSGYQLVSVELDVSNDNQGGYVNYSANFPGTYNPNGETINEARVKVKKVCATPTVTPTITPRPTTAPTTAPTAVPTTVPTVIPTAAPTTIPSITPVVTVAVDPSVTPSVSPEPTVTSTPTATPTDTPSTSTNNNNNSSSNNSSNNEVKVAGISALASTGGIIDSLMNSVFVSGLLTFAFGLKRHGKKS